MWCLALSIAFHFTIAPLLVWLTRGRPARPAPMEVVYVSRSTAVRTSHRTRPRPAHHTVRTMPAPRRQVPRTRRRLAAPAPARREIARIDMRSPHVAPPKTTYARTSVETAQQEQAFENTIARLRQQNDPVVSAARPVQTPQAPKRYTFDFAGAVGTAPRGEGILTPVRSWRMGSYDFYYVRYWVEYPDGTTETGIVPWPLRYLPGADPFRLGIQHFPLPVPAADYTLPPGTPLHPLVAYCYTHRDELASCPIHHD